MKTTFSFPLSIARAEAFITELENLHRIMPQPACGASRDLRVYRTDTDDGEICQVDLEYYGRDQQVSMGYYLSINKDGAVVTYTGEEENFGYGDVGPYRGMHQEIKPEQRTVMDAHASMQHSLDLTDRRLTQSLAALNEIEATLNQLKESHFVIRDTDGTGPTHYGHMSLYELDGIRFVTRPDEAEHLRGAKVVPCTEIPEFVAHLTLRMVINVHYKEIWVYVLKKEDIRALAGKLSASRRLTVNASARDLAVWKDGQLESGPYPLGHFYTNITPEQEESTRF